MVEPAKKAVLGGDLGGTKLAYTLYPVVDGQIMPTPITEGSVPVEKGAEGLKATIQEAYSQAIASAHGYAIVGAGIGSPGRPITVDGAPDNAFILAPTSAKNLEGTPGEFSNINLQPILQGDIPVPVYVNNDAIVQMQAMLVDALGKEGKTEYYGKKVGYIGPGTGLGGGFGEVDKRGNVTLHTDGHIYDVRLDMAQDMDKIKEINSRLEDKEKFQFDQTGNTIRAEDIISGTAFRKMAGYEATQVISAKTAEAARGTLEIMGRGLAELVTRIATGNIKKLDPSADWPDADLKKVEGTRIFLMGGGMANNKQVMNIIEETAQKELAAQGITDVRFISVPAKETTLAAASIVPQEVLRRSVAAGR